MTPLALAIESCEVFSEARASLDYGIHGPRVSEWIASHEKLRQFAVKYRSQAKALQGQIDRLQQQVVSET